MAIVNITLIEGRPTEVKTRLIAEVTDVLVKALDAKPQQVRVVINEVANGCYGVAGNPIFLNHEQ